MGSRSPLTGSRPALPGVVDLGIGSGVGKVLGVGIGCGVGMVLGVGIGCWVGIVLGVGIAGGVGMRGGGAGAGSWTGLFGGLGATACPPGGVKLSREPSSRTSFDECSLIITLMAAAHLPTPRVLLPSRPSP